MTPIQVIFIVTSIVMLLSAIYVVTRRNLVHAALYLVLAFFGTAVMFVLLQAGYLATVQILVNIGAIAILMIFAVMFTRHVSEEEKPYGPNSGYGFGAAFLAFAGLVMMLGDWLPANTTAPEFDSSSMVASLGAAFFSGDGYVIPTLAASILLLAALIGAIFVAWRRAKVEE